MRRAAIVECNATDMRWGKRAGSATLHDRPQRRQTKLGLETLCVGSGQGVAAIFERA